MFILIQNRCCVLRNVSSDIYMHLSKTFTEMYLVIFIFYYYFFFRSKESPFFGCTIAGTSKEEQIRWIGAMLAAEHPLHLLPSPELLQ